MAKTVFSSFLRIELERALQAGDLEKWNKEEVEPLSNKQLAMCEFFFESEEYKNVPGGPTNIIEVRAYKNEAGEFFFETNLKRSAAEYEKDVAAVKAAAVRAAAEEQQVAERSAYILRACELLKLKPDDVFGTPFPKLRAMVREAEKRQAQQEERAKKQAERKKKQKNAPKIEFKPAQLTGRVVDLNAIKK